MGVLKKVWITPQSESNGLVSLSMESAEVEEEHMRVKVSELEFPLIGTKEHPKRHTVCLSLLSEDDLEMLHDAIGRYLTWGE